MVIESSRAQSISDLTRIIFIAYFSIIIFFGTIIMSSLNLFWYYWKNEGEHNTLTNRKDKL